MGSPRRQEEDWESVLYLKSQGGGVRVGGGAEGPGGCERRIGEFFLGGGGQIYFFSGPKRPPSFGHRKASIKHGKPRHFERASRLRGAAGLQSLF